MPKVKGKVQLCSSEKRFFKSFQGLGEHSLFERYTDIENVVKNKIDNQYCYFLAQPVVEGDIITWFSKPFKEIPQRLSELKGDKLTKYEHIKNDTIAHYQSVISTLRNEGKKSEAESLENSTKFINDKFLYCYDDFIILGIWGMQLKDNVREPIGVAIRDLFIKKDAPEQDPIKIENDEEQIPDIPEYPLVEPFNIRFHDGGFGKIKGIAEFSKDSSDTISDNEVPVIEPQEGYEFIGWDKDPYGYDVTSDTEFTAQYRPIDPPIHTSVPWYRRFWDWLRALFLGRGCLRWLLWLLLILLLLFLLSWLIRRCSEYEVQPIPTPVTEKPWIHDNPNVGDRGGIYHPGNPYTPVPTPPEYREVLPPNQGLLPPVDTTRIIREPGKPTILGNRINILMENGEKSIMDLAKEFKIKYPENRYKVVYYDDLVKRMQIEVPTEERVKLKNEIPVKFEPEYKLFVFDESLFEGVYSPNDPAFSEPNKSWYLKTINAPQAWGITRGIPELTIAIVDNGFSLRHPELQSKVVMPYNVWLQSQEIFAQSVDHGTHVAGTALALMNNKRGLCGIAPESAFMPVQVANREGLMTTTAVLDGILYALYQGADIINVSLGMQLTGPLPEYEQVEMQNSRFKEEERLWNKVSEISDKHNAVIVVAAGNDNMLAGINPLNRPKNFIVVSALDNSSREFEKAGFSNFGKFTGISAPGVNIYSTVGDNSYEFMDGTSMAAPIVSGAVALMKSLNKDLTAEQILCILQRTGLHTEGNVGNLIQMDKALEQVRSGQFNDCLGPQVIPSTGDVQIFLSWTNYNDLDLVCIDPLNDTIWFVNEQVPSGGRLEIDMNVDYPDSRNPVENIYWPSGTAPKGTYTVHLNYTQKHIDINETPYQIIVKYGTNTKEFAGSIKYEDNSILIYSFTLGDATQEMVPPAANNRDALLRERQRLQDRIDQIDRELQNI